MTRPALPIAALLLAACAAVSTVLADAGQERSAARDRLLEAYHSPPVDPSQGRLYDAVAALLNSARELPKTLQLRSTPPAEAPPVEAEAAEPAADARPEAAPAEPPARAQWLTVLEEPVVSEEVLAHTHFLAGAFGEAAALYGHLREQNPEDEHVLLMLMLSERNAGNLEEAQALLAELRQKGAEAGEWADWMIEMINLGLDDTEEAQ